MLAALFFVPSRAAERVKNPDTYVLASQADANSLDPAWDYDSVSAAVVENIYDFLFAFEGSSTEKLLPAIATKVPTKENGLISADGLTYRIPIRKGVKFHDGSPMTVDDVRYSLLRFMLQDRASGPSGLLLEPLLGYASTRDAKGALNRLAFHDAVRAVEVDRDTLVLKLPRPFAPLLSILASWCPVVSKRWAIRHDDWHGTEGTWEKFNNPNKQTSPFFAGEMGTGPFKLERWDRKLREAILVRHDAYWRGPAKLQRAVVKAAPEFGTRRLMLLAGDADVIAADRSQISQLRGQPGVEVIDDLPALALDPILFFSYKINPVANPFIGSGRLDGEGIPPDFFADINIRRGVAYSIDYAGLIADVYRGKGTQATGCIPKGLAGHNPDQPAFTLDRAKAIENFKRARDGRVWEKGFRFTLTYNAGKTAHQILCSMIKRNIEALNPKFRVDVRPMDWPAFLDAANSGRMPLPIMTWSADYPDPHDFAYPLMHSRGVFPAVQHYSDSEADRIVEEALKETDMAKRTRLYARLQEIEHEDVPHLVLVDQARFRVQRSWVKGWVHSPIHQPEGGLFYPLFKAP
ncbi:MAG TPA: ABC transporter substrate-binding protein [Elusimicrobiota bacterium]|nr:ABC transporter substrate-binding protein [Elusimicrobiota bacterium]